MSLEKVLNAESVAIVGASTNETKRGYQAIRILIDEKFGGKIYPVNPKEKSILGLKCYPKVSAIEGPVDIALITTPANTIPAILADCGLKGVHGAVIIAGGFGELGEEGRALETRMVETAQKHGIRLIGPKYLRHDEPERPLKPRGAEKCAPRQYRASNPERKHGLDPDHGSQAQEPHGIFLLCRRGKRGGHQVS